MSEKIGQKSYNKNRSKHKMNIKIKRIENGKIPEYKTDGSAGADCYARLDKPITISPGEVKTIPLGFAVELPIGYEMQIRGRSGLARKNFIEVFNSPGTIDSDYRGEVNAILYYAPYEYDEEFVIKPGDRIAQAVICPVIKAEWHLTENLSETERGEGGFGSTGISENEEIKMSYPHKIEKFYEPFTRMKEIIPLIGKNVIIDNSKQGKVLDVGKNNEYIVIKFQVIRDNLQSADTINMFAAQAFERVKIDGHRFGKEIEFEG